MNNRFNFMSIHKDPHSSEGVYQKNGSEIIITFDHSSSTNKFKDFIRNKIMIESVSFYNEPKNSGIYSGPFKVININGNTVILEKV